MRQLLLMALLVFGCHLAIAQVNAPKFGKGIPIYGQDSSFYIKFGLRFQNLFINEWKVEDELGESGGWTNHTSNFLVRRARIKFYGYAYTPKLKYKIELGLTNQDIRGAAEEFNDAPKFILDAYIQYNFYKNLSIKVGQGKLPGNRERVISSGDMQFVDRSRLNSRYNIDRDMGIHLLNHHRLGGDVLVREIFSFTQGEGRNVTLGNPAGGYDYTFRVELLPFGEFADNGDYKSSDMQREEQPKLAIGISYNSNQNAGRTRGQNGSFLRDSTGIYVGKDLNAIFVDAMFKYRGWNIMMEYVDKTTGDGDPFLRYPESTRIIGRYYTGSGFNLALGYLFKSNYELALRYTHIQPDELVANPEREYTLGLSKFIVGHKLKVQTDISYRQVQTTNDLFFWRMQMDLHF